MGRPISAVNENGKSPGEIRPRQLLLPLLHSYIISNLAIVEIISWLCLSLLFLLARVMREISRLPNIRVYISSFLRTA